MSLATGLIAASSGRSYGAYRMQRAVLSLGLAALMSCTLTGLGGVASGQTQVPQTEEAEAFGARFREAILEADQKRFDRAEELLDRLISEFPEQHQVLYYRGRVRFCRGNFEGSAVDFDAYYEAVPEARNRQWERGITLYFAGRYQDGADQFEEYQTYHDADVENAAWRYLCEARVDGAEQASENLMPVGPDRRVPMMKIHALYGGKAEPAEVFLECEKLPDASPAKNAALFYAHLYVGLWYESRGDEAKAKEHLVLAAESYPIDHYMGFVAKVHPWVVRRESDSGSEN